MWWEAMFKGGDQWITSVRVLNRKDCCGGRLGATQVLVGKTECGEIESGTTNGKWYTVECKVPIKGDRIRLVTT
jgi:hypothetical protein